MTTIPIGKQASIWSRLRTAWQVLTRVRRGIFGVLLNLLLVAGVLALLVLFLRPSAPPLKDKTALVLNIDGALVEQRTALNLREQAMGLTGGPSQEQTQLRDVLSALDAAAKDARIAHVVLSLDNLGSASLPVLREVANAIERFKASGKPVYAWGSNYDQRAYFLAAHANELWLHPMGMVYVEGYGRYRTYYKDLFDKLGVSAKVIRAGKFKSAAETFSANAPSAETLQAEGLVWQTLWASYTAKVEAARKQPTGSIAAAIDSLPGSLQAVQGNPARWAIERKWVDALKTRDEVRELLSNKGAADEENKTFRQIDLGQYLKHAKGNSSGPAVGVVVAQGAISDGTAGTGSVGGLSTAKLIRKARDNDQIKALVLRVDSPGGSAFGSELVRRELELTRKAGKPVVVSMGGLAASGGYWISMAADEILADEATITGSIGVVAVLPQAQGALDKWGVRTGGIATTWLTGQGDPRRAIDPRFEQLMQSAVDGGYKDFIALVADARKSTPEKIHELAQGRVWSGKDALARGLVDKLGGLGDAVGSATRLAKLPADTRLMYIEVEPPKWQRLADMAGGSAQASQGATPTAPGLGMLGLLGLLENTGLAAGPAQAMAQELAWFATPLQANKPFATAAHCLCLAP
jgi:protease IV